MLSRRSLMRSVLLLSAGSACSVSAARALTLDAEPPSGLAQLYHAAKDSCSLTRDAYHQELLAEAEAMLANRELSAEQRLALLVSVSCPICGCRVAGS